MLKVKHSFTSTKPDGTDTSLVRPKDWNAEHLLLGSLSYQELTGTPPVIEYSPYNLAGRTTDLLLLPGEAAYLTFTTADTPAAGSSTSITIGTGSKTFTVADGTIFNVGSEVTAQSLSIVGCMTGEVTAKDATTITVDVTTTVGSGTKTDWHIVTRIPLHVEVVEGMYEIDIACDRSINNYQTTRCSYLQPNNLSTAPCQTIVHFASRLNDAYAPRDNPWGFDLEYGTLWNFKGTITTYTKNKSWQGLITTPQTASNRAYQFTQSGFWADRLYSNADGAPDTTTEWTSLGCLALAVAQSGTFFIRRIL